MSEKIKTGDLYLSSGKKSDDIVNEHLENEKISPFVIYPNMTYVRTKRKDCSSTELRRMMINGSISDVHDKIIKILGQYGYLNSFMIRTLLSHLTGGMVDYCGAVMRKVLKKLVDMGFLTQYELFHVEDGTKQGSPFIYTLSNGGIKYLKKQGIDKFHPLMMKTFDISNTLGLLAFNQFHIMLLKQYGLTNILISDDYYGMFYSSLDIAQLYRLRLPQGGMLSLFVQPIRNDFKWTHIFLNTLRKAKEYATKTEMSCFAVLIICETEYQAMECARKKNCEAELRDMNTFYITDTSVVTEEDVFGRLIDVQPKKDYSSRRTFKLDFRQSTTQTGEN